MVNNLGLSHFCGSPHEVRAKKAQRHTYFVRVSAFLRKNVNLNYHLSLKNGFFLTIIFFIVHNFGD